MKSNSLKKKETTIDDLAIMVANGFRNVDKRMDGFDKRMDGFDKRMDTFDKRMDGFEQELKSLKDLVKFTRQDVLNIGDKFVSRFEFERLLSRVGKIEKRLQEKGN
jgi:archaellum component FlaC